MKDKDVFRDRMISNYVKGINTLREVLKNELCLSSLYDKYIQIHGNGIDLENTSRLLIRVKLLLEGRKILAQILMIIVERNEMVNELKLMIENEKNNSDSSYAGDGDLGELKFSEAKAKDLGTTIVQFTKVIQALIRQLQEIKSFPGIRCNSL